MSDLLNRVKDARVWLSVRVPFLGYMTTRLRPRLSNPQDSVPTAGVAPDGTLVITTSRLGLDESALASAPLSGGLFIHP